MPERTRNPALAARRRRLIGPAIVLGMGLGGFVDGIVLHQILQWHHLLSDTPGYEPVTVANLEVNTLADGLFHAATWVLVVGGLVWGWSRRDAVAAPGAGRTVCGGLAVGWGAFNLVEGVVDHHLLQVHHVRPAADNPLLYDLAFLALGAALVAAGAALIRPMTRRSPMTDDAPLRPDDVVDLETAARMLDVTPDRIDVLVADGLLEPVPERGDRMFEVASVVAVRTQGG